MTKVLKYHWRAVVWVLVIIIGCFAPSSEVPDTSSFLSRIIPKIERFIGFEFDKIIHFTLYFVFTLLLLAGFTRQYEGAKFKSYLLSFILALICGGLVEIIQPFVGRSGDWNDMFANATGALVALVLFGPVKWILKNIL